MKKKFVIVGLSVLLIFSIWVFYQQKQVHDESDFSEETILETETVLSPDEESIRSTLLGLEELMQDCKIQVQNKNSVEDSSQQSFCNYAASELWDYMNFLYDVYDQMPFPYYSVAAVDLEQDTEYLYTDTEKYFYQVSFVIFPNTSEEFMAQGTVCLELEQDRKEWVITEISQPYIDLMYYYFPDLLKAIYNSDEYFFSHRKMEEEMLSRELLDAWLQVAGKFEIHEEISALSANRGYILADSSKRILAEEEITQLDPLWSYFAIQEIYARKGKKYEDYILHWYFTLQDWYAPWEKNFANEEITEVEKQNILYLMNHVGIRDVNDYLETGALYGSEKSYGLSDEEADNIITGIYHKIKNMMEPDMTKLVDEEDPNSSYLLKGEPNEEEMKDRLLEYIGEDALERVYLIMGQLGVHYSQINESYHLYVAGEWINYSIDSLRPFHVLGEDENGYKIEVPLWIGSVHGTGRSRAYIWLKQKEGENWKIVDIIMDIDNIVVD